MMNRKKLFILTVVFDVIVLGAIACLNYYGTFYRNNIKASASKEDAVKVYRSFSYEDLCDAMVSSGVLDNVKTFRRAAKNMGLDKGFKPGYYTFSAPMSNKAIVRTLAKGWQKPVNISFPGYARTLEAFAAQLSDKFEADSASFAGVLLDEATMSKYGFDRKDFIGMFIPNTYEMYWTATPEEFVERMNKEYNAFWNDNRKAKAKAAGLTQKEVSTLASIVIEESKYEPELPTIAGVYINRLNIDMPLQADPTVKFAVGDASLKRILNKHLTFDSPYNTYLYKGLPPGPITMPPMAALDAVLNYQHHNYLYFCAKETFDGQHNFARTLSEHNANAERYHRALSARGN